MFTQNRTSKISLSPVLLVCVNAVWICIPLIWDFLLVWLFGSDSKHPSNVSGSLLFPSSILLLSFRFYKPVNLPIILVLLVSQNLMYDLKTNTSEVVIKVVREDKEWRVAAEDTLVDLIFGDISDLVETIGDVLVS